MNQSSLEKWLTPGLGQGKDKMSVEYLVAPESKNTLQHDGGMLNGHRSQIWDDTNNKITFAPDDDPEDKINIHESMMK